MNAIANIMNLIADMGIHVMVRIDPLREKNRFTVVVDGIRAGDTDDPEKLLRHALDQMERGAYESLRIKRWVGQTKTTRSWRRKSTR